MNLTKNKLSINEKSRYKFMIMNTSRFLNKVNSMKLPADLKIYDRQKKITAKLKKEGSTSKMYK